MQFDEAVRLITAKYGLSAPPGDAEEAAAFAVDQQEVLLYPGHDGEGCCLEARLGCLKGLRSEILLDMMASNRWPSESRAGVLAIDEAFVAFLIQRVAGSGLAAARFQALVQRFAANAGLWRAHIGAASVTSQAPPLHQGLA